MNSNTGPAILNRVIDPETGDLAPEAAKSILRFDFPAADHQRMAELSKMAAAGKLKRHERHELNEYLWVADMLAVLQSKARKSLKRVGLAS